MLDAKVETFLKTVELKSYTAAAEALHLTQPAVTQHIRKLEAYYGCLLIDSSRRSVHVTDAGRILYDYLSLQSANEKRFSEFLSNIREPLRVGATLSIADYYLTESLIRPLAEGEERIRVMVGNTAHLLEQLETGELDGAFIEGLFDTTLLETRTFHQARFLPVVRADHPLLGRKATLQELRRFPIVLREPHSGTREVFENWLEQQNSVPQSFVRLVELGSFVMIKRFVEQSQAVTFVYEAVVKEELACGKLCKLDLEGFDVTHDLRFVYRRGDAGREDLNHLFEKLVSSM